MGASVGLLTPPIRISDDESGDNSSEEWKRGSYLSHEVLRGIQQKAQPHQISRKRYP
jgi:hypothetical protein